MTKSLVRVAAGKKSRRKGAGFELKTAKEFQKWWGKGSFARSPSSGGWAQKPVRDDFRAAGDIITTALDFPWCLECKNQEGWSLDQLLLNDGCIIWKWWEQTVDETPEGLEPMLIFKKNRQKAMVMVSVDAAMLYPKYDFNSPTLEDLSRPPSIPSPIKTRFSFFHEKGNIVVFPLAELFAADPYMLGRTDDE